MRMRVNENAGCEPAQSLLLHTLGYVLDVDIPDGHCPPDESCS